VFILLKVLVASTRRWFCNVALCRNKLRKVLVNLTVGKSKEPVRYHKVS